MKHNGDTEDIPTSLLNRFPVSEVHKIAILDVRSCNTDRHGGNVLWREDKDNAGSRTVSLIPIDHGYTIPSDMAEVYFNWLIWPQAKQPFDAKAKQYIKKLDVEADVRLLKEKFGRSLDDRHCRILRVCTTLLKLAAEADLTPFNIGEMMSRVDLKQPCLLEQLCSEAERMCNYVQADAVFLAALKPKLQREIAKIAAQRRQTPSLPVGSPSPLKQPVNTPVYGPGDLDEADLFDE